MSIHPPLQTQPTEALAYALSGIPHVSAEELQKSVAATVLPDMSPKQIRTAQVYAARSLIQKQPEYSSVTARLLLDIIYHEVLDRPIEDEIITNEVMRDLYPKVFADYIRYGIKIERLSPDLLRFDLDALGQALVQQRDLEFTYLGLQTLYDRYFIHDAGRRLETPQVFWMRVAMGLAVNEDNPTARATQFYNIMSTFRFCPSSPTLFNAGTLHPQLSSCFLTTIDDDLDHIFQSIKNNALLSKWSGGIGNDWTNVRATGSHIKGTNGKSQGIVPFLKVANDTAVAVNQGGKRRGAVCAYLETWHLDIEDFLQLRRNSGDDRRRTHDMHTAHWIPDLFMKRVEEDAEWTLFSPSDVPDLHGLYGKQFEQRYAEYELLADAGEIEDFRRIKAKDLWRRMLTMLFETGHPWITFKDPSNIRSPQDHAGVVHHSNLCTEILLNTDKEEVAVCNLGSVNLAYHVNDHSRGLTGDLLHVESLRETIAVAVRMLDNVVDINFYPIPEAERSNMRHRPVGLGLMGFQDALHKLGITYASEDAARFADVSMEHIAYAAIMASSNLAKERGSYLSYPGSKWDRGILPLDSLASVAEERGQALDVNDDSILDWTPVREMIRRHGMRNSNVLAIAPTATISNIVGVSQSIEPDYRLLYTKSNLSGDFTIVNRYLVNALRMHDLWDDEMVQDLLFYDGVISEIDRIPDDIKVRFKTAFEIDPDRLIDCAARRQKWIDMGQSLNLYLAEPSGRKLSDMYMNAWKKGLKTTYYLRSLGASQIEKSTIQEHHRQDQPRWRRDNEQDDGRNNGADTALSCHPNDDVCDACQ